MASFPLWMTAWDESCPRWTGPGRRTTRSIVYASDHGDMMGDHGLWTKQVMCEASAGIPMVVAGPGVPEGEAGAAPGQASWTWRRRQSMQLRLHEPHGRTPSRAVRCARSQREADDPNRTVFSEYHDGGSTTGSFMVRWEHWKFVYYVGHDAQLFNLALDPS